MKTISKGLTLLLAAVLIIGLNSCKKDKEVDKTVTFNFDFLHTVNNQAVVMDTIMYTNDFGNNFSVSTIKYFLSDIVLHKNSGDIKLDMAHYIDAKTPSTTTYSKSAVIKEDDVFTGISFIYGLNETRNVAGAFPNPPANTMEWPIPLGGGYHYMKLEGKHNDMGSIKNFQCHTGPTNGNPYYKAFTFNNGFTVEGTSKNIEIIMNIEKWFSTPNALDLNTVTMIMGNTTMQEKLQQNVADVFTVAIK